MTLEHNVHRNYYMSAAEWIEEREAEDREALGWISVEQREKAIETGSVWTLQWYPKTPVSFCLLSAADLDVLIAAANEQG